MSQQVEEQRLANQQLRDAIENSDDPDTLERVARERGYVKKGRPCTATWPAETLMRAGGAPLPARPTHSFRGNLQGGYFSQ